MKTRIVGIGIAVALVAAALFVGAGGAANGHASAQAVCPAPDTGAARCHALVVTDAHGNPAASTTPSGYGPAQFHGAYGLSSTSQATSTQTIGIVDAYDDPTITSDLAAYDKQFGLAGFPSCTSTSVLTACFLKVGQTGSTRSLPRGNSGWALEISLDVETAHELCQNCRIVLVEASSNSFANLGAAENEAVALGANVVSNSWGGAESSSETTMDSYFDHPGVAITASTGDSGYGTEYPASSQYVVGVGGTTLNLAGTTWSSETAWADGGSGCSAYEPKPAWQTSATGCSKKAVADVSADADPNTGAAVYDTTRYSGRSGWFQVGGTSLASPLIAGTYALAGSYGAGPNAASLPWAQLGVKSALHDVASGSNGSCSTAVWCNAGAGWDGPTGVGTPSGTGAF